MDDKLFNELVMSIKDAGRFLRGESEPSRTFDAPDIKAICKPDWRQSDNLAKLGTKTAPAHWNSSRTSHDCRTRTRSSTTRLTKINSK